MVFEVFEPNFHKFKQKLEKIKTIDEVLEEHNHFLDLCLKESMLLDHTLFQLITKLTETSNYFSKIITRITNNIMQEEELLDMFRDHDDSIEKENEDTAAKHKEYVNKRKEKLKKLEEENQKVASEQSFVKMVQKFEKNFEQSMKQLLHLMKNSQRYETHVANLATRLDYNQYYSSKLFQDEI